MKEEVCKEVLKLLDQNVCSEMDEVEEEKVLKVGTKFDHDP